MKKKLLFIGKDKNIRERLSDNNYTIVFSENEKNIDLILSTEEHSEKISNMKINDIPVLMMVDDETKLDEILEKNRGLKINDFILHSYDNNSMIEKIDNAIILNKLQREREKIKKEEKDLITKLRTLSQKNRELYLKAKNLNEEKEIEDFANVYSEKYIKRQIEKELARVKRTNSNFALTLISMNNLEYLNKKYSDFIGEQAIRARVSRIILDSLRKSDILGIVNENIFCIIFTEIIEDYSLKVIERLIQKIEGVKIKSNNLELTASYFDINAKNSDQFSDLYTLMNLGTVLLEYAKKNDVKILKYKKESHDINEMCEKVDFARQEEKNSLILEELSKSQKFIEKLLPKKKEWKNKLNYAYLYYPFNYIGGDFFDFIEIDDDKIAILFCDVSGHGVSSALYITAIKYIFKNIIKEEGKYLPKDFMPQFNQSIIEISEGNIFVAASYGVLDKKAGKLLYSFGGGTSPILLQKEKKDMMLLEKNGGFAIGLVDEAEFYFKEIYIGDGDILFFYSDGIYEFLIEKGLIEDENDFYTIVRECIDFNEQVFLTNIYNHVRKRILSDLDFDDDITLLALRNEQDN